MSNAKFGELIGAPSTQIRAYETGKNNPKIDALVKLIEFTGISFYDLCTRILRLEEIPASPLDGSIPNNINTLGLIYDKEIDDLMLKINIVLRENKSLRVENETLKKRNN